jgi:Ca2+-binding RTX toxin-like protein
MDGGTGIDTAVVNGAGLNEAFTVTAAGAGVRFDRTIPGLFGIDIRATERLELNAGAGNDSFTATGNLAGRIALIVNGDAGDDTLDGGNGNDLIDGGADDDTLNGDAGNDTLKGGTGTDKMAGGAGNDVYFVDSDQDLVTENAKEGIDRVESSVSFTLSANIENLTLAGAAAISGTGNELANIIDGNDDNNGLNGLGGNDTLNGAGGNDSIDGDDGNDLLNGGNGDDNLFGEAGDDTLNGNDGNDTLDGGAGNDRMTGGKGDDTYFVDSAKDTVIESANQGVEDTVQSSINYTLGAHLEFLELLGDADLNGTGNALDNGIFGNAGRNSLNGGAGDDFLEGDAGDDILICGAGNDVVNGGAGFDVIDGGLGNDSINVGGDNVGDLVRYTVNSASELSRVGFDTIHGFVHGEDKISLSDLFDLFNIDPDDAFSGGFLKIEVGIIDTQLLFDRNGGGNSFITLATLTNVTNVTADDLITTPL